MAQPSLEEQEPTPQEVLLADIMQRLDDAGDLPIFSASVNRVQMVGSDPAADADALAKEVLKDANLTTKILKLANSSYYSRGGSKVGALSRAIVVLGFDLLKTTVLTMKLIDSFQEQERPDTGIERMLVKAYMSAGFVKEIAEAVGAKSAEQSYVCGLLHNMGEVIVASVMPEKYQEIHSLVTDDELSWLDAQKTVMGMTLQQIGQAVVEKWEFPDSVSNTMAPPKAKPKGKIRDQVELNQSLSSLTNDMMDLIYSENPVSTRSFTELAKEMVTATGVSQKVVVASLDKAFKQSCDLAENYGLSKTHLMPNTNSTRGKDTLRDDVIKNLAIYIDPVASKNYDGEEDEDYDDGYDDEPVDILNVGSDSTEQQPTFGVADTNIFLTILQQLTAFIAQKAPLNTVFGAVLEGMTQGVGFDRAMLCLITPNRKSYSSRIAMGNKSDKIREMFQNRQLDVRHDLFSKVVIDGGEILVADIHAPKWSKLLTPNDKASLDTRGFLIASLQVQGKPVGLFYADNISQKTEISAEQFRGFLQLVAQAQLALQIR